MNVESDFRIGGIPVFFSVFMNIKQAIYNILLGGEGVFKLSKSAYFDQK